MAPMQRLWFLKIEERRGKRKGDKGDFQWKGLRNSKNAKPYWNKEEGMPHVKHALVVSDSYYSQDKWT